jgi:hypothetical protein
MKVRDSVFTLAEVHLDYNAVKSGDNVQVTGAARLYRAESVWTAGLCHLIVNCVNCIVQDAKYRTGKLKALYSSFNR